MTPIPYHQARLQVQPGDALLTAEPGLGSGVIRLWTGDAWSHIAAGAERSSDHTGMMRSRVVQSNAGLGVHLLPTSRWLQTRHGRVAWIRARLSDAQRGRFTDAVDTWLGCSYEDARTFIRSAVGLPGDDGQPGDDDVICSALYAALWHMATAERIPGRPWFRWGWARKGRDYVPTPGACARHLLARGGELVELVRPPQTLMADLDKLQGAAREER